MEKLYSKYNNILRRKNSLEVKQYKLEQHIKENPTDYTAIIANELIKSDIFREDMKLTEVKKRLAIHEVV